MANVLYKLIDDYVLVDVPDPPDENLYPPNLNPPTYGSYPVSYIQRTDGSWVRCDLNGCESIGFIS
jgi:hypothetical protein